jgi:ubiquinone/menaquinone biosynthesis C-methylase UbiE
VDLGVNVQFVHGVAEDLPYPDGSFDAVLAYILFHEVPSRLFDKIIGEVFRVLRPGGTFSIVDAPNNVPLPGPNRMWLAYDAQYNCEPYSPAFVASDLEAMLGNAGFDAVERQTTSTFLMSTTCQRPVG